jgi:hypothetical protein
LGAYSLKVTASTTANNGAQFSLNPVVTAQSTQYTISWFAKLDGTSSAMTDMAAIYSPEGTTLNTCTPTSGTVSTSGWTRYSCAVTDSTHAPTTSGFVRILQTGTTAGHIYYVDAVQMEAAATASAYGAGSVSLNGIITSPVVFRSAAATTAFQIQNSSNLSLFGADSLNNLIQIGSSVSHASNPVVLVLDNYNNATDPSGGQQTNGAMYYNASTGKFRCYQNSAWANCIATGIASFTVLTSTTANSTYTVPSGVTSIMAEIIGSGGAGGSSAGAANNAGAGGGGGAGGYARKVIVGPAATYKYTIGTGGTAGAAGNNAGGNGNQTCFGTNATACTSPIFNCNGGNGGAGSGAAGTTNVSSAGGTGGSCTSGDLNLTGGTGGKGSRWLGTTALAGNGAATTFGMGGQGNGVTGTGDAASTNSYGAGGAGACSIGNTNSQGGAGQQGVIIIWEFK